MNAPVQPMPAVCDICSAEAAVASLMNLQDYSQVKVGPSCMPEFFASLAGDTAAAAPAPVPPPGAPASAQTAPQTLDEDPVTGNMVPVDLGPRAAAGGPPAAATMPAPDIVRQADAEAAQLALLRMLGIVNPDAARCPQCDTVAHGWPGIAAYVCPYCATLFGDGWARLQETRPPGLTIAGAIAGLQAAAADAALDSEPGGINGPPDVHGHPGTPTLDAAAEHAAQASPAAPPDQVPF